MARLWGKARVLTAVLGILLNPALGLALTAAEETCTTCHTDVVHDSPLHGSFPCTSCHANIEGYPHPDEPIGERRGAALCATCHEAAAHAEGVHAAFACLDCHGPAHKIDKPAADACATCHPAAVDELAGSVHAKAARCQDCHGPAHDVLPSSNRASQTAPIHQFETCGRCHQANDLVSRYLASSHAKALLLKGLVAAPACSNCHGSHTVLPPSNPQSSLSRQHAPETCGACHVLVLDTWKGESSHGALWVAGKDNGPVCTTCHRAHEDQRFSERSDVLKTPERCGACHEERFSTYSDSFHGKATSLGFLTGAICSDCHSPHENLPAADPRSSIHPDHLLETCGRCHEQANAAFVSFDPHIDPRDPASNAVVHYVWLFMTALLLGVFGFFAVHDLLWLQRALVGWSRGEFEGRPVAEGPHIRRFTDTHVALHRVVMLTFLVLAATGLPLKFHSAPWARTVTALLGGIELMRILHRFAAIVTFGYAVFYLAYLFYQVVIRREGGLFWGWKSMVPRPKDFADLFGNLRYFLYLGPRPAFDHWGYWEKFDYFAVFWGIPIIGFSGLILWFPAFFTQWLPGWALNAAMVVHSDEALLAVGFIFVFHFFHTHLRPESFPLDPVIFTGLVPLERFKEERPVEYQRLVESGELKQHLVDPPSPAAIRRARIVGGISVSVGMFLVVAIFAALLSY